jgi:hypothetical protein
VSKQPGRYQLDFIVAASNAKAIHRTAHIVFRGWQKEERSMFHEDGGLDIKITKTPERR